MLYFINYKISRKCRFEKRKLKIVSANIKSWELISRKYIKIKYINVEDQAWAPKTFIIYSVNVKRKRRLKGRIREKVLFYIIKLKFWKKYLFLKE